MNDDTLQREVLTAIHATGNASSREIAERTFEGEIVCEKCGQDLPEFRTHHMSVMKTIDYLEHIGMVERNGVGWEISA